MRTVAEETWEVHEALTDLDLPYAIIGGAAVQIWGEPRFTKDLDLTVFVSIESFPEAVGQVLVRLHPRIDDALAFARRNRVLLVQTSTGYPVDVSFGLPGFEEGIIGRAVTVEIASGKDVQFCSPEDLIIYKAVAGRVLDVLDIQNIVSRQKAMLDVPYIRNWTKIFADLLESNDVIDRFEQAWSKYGPQS